MKNEKIEVEADLYTEGIQAALLLAICYEYDIESTWEPWEAVLEEYEERISDWETPDHEHDARALAESEYFSLDDEDDGFDALDEEGEDEE